MLLSLLACTWISPGDLEARLDAGKPTCTDEVWYDGTDQACDGGSDYDRDGDGYDSYVFGGTDCDDAHATVRPGAVEACDTPEDDDCDGLTDVEGAGGCVTWAYDADGDGTGTDATQCWCEPQEATGFDAPVGGDCDDADADVYPGATERCDVEGTDEDCDGLADDDAGAEAEGRVRYFPDRDRDGYGDAEDVGTLSCVPVDTWATDGTDCDDTTNNVFPGASEGVADGVDQDCDTTELCWVDADGDTFRAADTTLTVVSGDVACDGPGESAAFDADDCDDADPAIPGIEAWDARDNDCDGATDDLHVDAVADGVLYGASASLGLGASHTLSLGGDLDGDGLDDLVLLSETGATGSGWVVSGGDATGASGAVGGYARATLTGQASYVLGYVSGPMADVTRDGTADLLVGGSYAAYGRVWLLDGTLATGGVALGATHTARWEGDGPTDLVRGAATGDVDGDGNPDVVIAAVYDAHVGSAGTDAYTGSVSVYAGDALDDLAAVGDATDIVYGSAADDYLGQSLAVADFTGDGYADVIAGAPGGDEGGANAGAVYVFPGSARAAWIGERADDAATFVVLGATASAALGNDALATPGDLAGTGGASLALSSFVSGEAWVFLDPAALSGNVALADADAAWVGTPSSFAAALACASDLDGDGADDLAIGARADDTRATDAGAVFLYFGGGAWGALLTDADADVSLYGAAADDALGSGLAAGGDLDGDGFGDLLLGAPGIDTLATGGGAAYVLRGR
ncbi:MAG: MopE-related protein [Pseudomonadota bacterium]|nr:MopE-related protein [Pseudomonadota bacterium]